MAQPTALSTKPAKRVLIYRLGSIGDTIVALPALRIVARAFPDAHRRMLTNIPVNVKAPSAATILENTGLVHSYERYTVGTRSPLGLLKLWWKIFSWRPQVLIYLAGRRGLATAARDRAFFRLCGIRLMYGLPDREGFILPTTDPQQDQEPESDFLCRCIAELGEGYLDRQESWDLCLTPAEHARASEVLAPVAGMPLIAVSVGTKMQSKDWGRQNWREVLACVAERYPRHALLLAGAPEESEASEFAAQGWLGQPGAGPAVNVCGLLTPRQTAAAFSRARIFLGHDSGPMHLAATVQVRCVAIFAALSWPRIWYPHGPGHKILYHRVDCAGCGLETCIVQQKKCITSITLDEVMHQIAAVMDTP
jgi:ADP-heptose:LPS heptosyltransferase